MTQEHPGAKSVPTANSNQLQRILQRLAGLPTPWRNRLIGFGFGLYSRFFRTCKLRIEVLEPHEVTLSLANHRKVGNHIGGIHAVAITLACEYGSGLLLGQHVPDSAVVVVKSMRVDLHRRVQGAIRATARLGPQAVARLHDEPKGDIEVPVVVVDESGAQPITGVMHMAWIPRRRPDPHGA